MTPTATQSPLKVEQLQQLANDPAATRSLIDSVLLALAGTDEEAQWASEALENCGTPSVATLPVLTSHIKHPAELIASWSCKLLARIGHEASAAEPLLVEALVCRTEELVREEAARALGQLGNLSTAARTALTTASITGGPRLKRLATASLGG